MSATPRFTDSHPPSPMPAPRIRPRPRPAHLRLVSLCCAAGAAVIALAGCGSSTNNGTEPQGPARLVVVSGSGQSADLGQPLASPLVVQVTTASNAAVSGVPVSFAVTSGSGSVSAPSATTNAQGQASVSFTMGQSPGGSTVTATAAALPGASAVFLINSGPTITGHVVVGSLVPRLPELRASPPVPLRAVPARPVRGARLDVAFRPGVLGTGRVGALSVSSLAAAREVAAGLRAHLEASTIARLYTVTDVSPVIGAARITLRDPARRDSVLAALRADPLVAAAGVDGTLSRTPIAKVALSRTLLARQSAGRRALGTGGITFPPTGFADIQLWHYALIDAPRAWTVTTGKSSVVVAVIDDGINAHPDIVGNLDMAGGYDFVEDDSAFVGGPFAICSGGSFTNFDDDGDSGPDPDPTMPIAVTYDPVSACYAVDDIANHGLHVAGTIGAGGSPGANASGVDWTVKIRPVRALGIDGSGYDFDIAQAVLYAAGLPAAGQNGQLVTAPNRAPIINMSLGGPGSDTTLQRAVAAAIGAGSVIIAAAGNTPSTQPSFPASYPGVIAVGALGPDGNLASYTSSGADLSLVAPGGDFRFDDLTNPYTAGTSGVLSTTWDFTTGTPSYAFYTGTSMAAPHVSGVAALVLAQNPGLSGSALAARLLSTARDLGPSGFDQRYGYGLVDAYAAVTGQQPVTRTFVRAIDSGTGVVVKQVQAAADGSFTLTLLPPGSYYVVAGQDEGGDGLLGFPGRRMGWAGGTQPAAITADATHVADATVVIGAPVEQSPNDAPMTPQQIFVDGWIAGSINASNGRDFYRVMIPAAGTYTIETSGVLGTCMSALELNTAITLRTAAGAAVATNDNSSYFSASGMTFPGLYCSKISTTLQPGTYTIEVDFSTTPAGNPGSYRLQVRTGA